MIVNVSATHTAIVATQLSRHDLLIWINTTLKANFTKVDELCTGAAYCQLMHSLYPKMVPIKRVKFCTNLEHEFIDNFKILQTVFQKLQVQKAIPIDRLVRGKFQDNIEFLQWFKKFYDANSENKFYDPVSVRNGQPMAFGSAPTNKRRDVKCCSPRVGNRLPYSHREVSTFKNVVNKDAAAFKRSLTRTELRHDLSMSPSLLMETPTIVVAHENLTMDSSLDAHNKSVGIPREMCNPSSPAYLANADFKLERILAYCLDAKAAGLTNLDISKVKHIIYNQTDSTENDLDHDAAQLGAGDHIVAKDVVEES